MIAAIAFKAIFLAISAAFVVGARRCWRGQIRSFDGRDFADALVCGLGYAAVAAVSILVGLAVLCGLWWVVAVW